MKYSLIHQEPAPAPNDNYKEFLLKVRGVADTKGFLNPQAEHLHSPYLLDNILEGAKLLVKHINNQSNIFLQVDSDVDGYTSSAILYQYIQTTFGQQVEWRVHAGKEHGIILNTIPPDTNLVLVVDAGSNQYLEHAALREKGIDVIIIDHHEAQIASEAAIVINNQLSANYPNKNLCGAGMVYKFCQVVDDLVGAANANDHLDLVAVGLVADMMDMRELENRYLVQTGLRSIKNSFIKNIIEKQAFSIGDTSNITPTHVSFYIAPLINALVRVGLQSEKEIMFKAFIDGDALVPSTKRGSLVGDQENLAEQSTRNCTNARSRQNRAKEKALAQIENYIKDNDLLKHKILFVPLAPGIIEKNLSGLVASQLVSKYKKPVLLGHEKEGVFSGSGRGNDRSLLKEFKAFLGSTELFNYVEGHQNAFGFELSNKSLEQFQTISNKVLEDIDFQESVYEVDFILKNGDSSNKKLLKDISEMQSIFGKGVEEPLIAVEDIYVEKITLMGAQKNTMKIQAQDQVYILFRTNEDEFEKLKSQLPAKLSVVGRASANKWDGNITYQIIINDLEVVEKNICYF